MTPASIWRVSADSRTTSLRSVGFRIVRADLDVLSDFNQRLCHGRSFGERRAGDDDATTRMQRPVTMPASKNVARIESCTERGS